MNGPAAIGQGFRIAIGGERSQLSLRAERRGARSVLTRQFVTYPFHLTRPFALDEARPEIATLYLQSSSGGLYADDRLRTEIDVAASAALHVTTQSSTMVLGHQGRSARSSLRTNVGAGAFFAYTPDPLILFPGSAADTEVSLDLDPGGAAILTEGLLLHDPKGCGAAPLSYRSVTEVSVAGRPVFVDRQRVAGSDLAASDGPLRGYRAAGSALLLGPCGALVPAAVEAAAGGEGVLAGVTALPGGVGLGVRILAPDGATFQAAMQAVFAAAFAAQFGTAPAPRRK